jgi:glycosyltransferase involved in cell wall biosynthesis
MHGRCDAGPSLALPMMRILQVIPTYYPTIRYGGPIRAVHALARALVRRRHEVHVYTTSADGDSDLPVESGREVYVDGVRVTYFKVPALRRLYWAPAMRTRLRQTAGDFDVIHLHSVFLWPTWAAARAAQRAGVPYLLAPRGQLVGELIRRKSRLLKQAWIKLIEQGNLAHAAGLHVTTELEAENAKALKLRLPPLFCVPNGVEWPAHPAPLEEGPFASVPRPYALFLSRINWKKGLDRLLLAWRDVPDLHLLIAGNDEDGYRAELERQAAAAGVTDRVRFLGPASDEHKWALYSNAEMFVLPSYSENFGNVIAEAMAMSCPVIVTPQVGLASLLRETGAGLVCDGEPHVFAATVRSLHADRGMRRDMGARGRQVVAERLSWDAVAARMEAAYREIEPDTGPLMARGRCP